MNKRVIHVTQSPIKPLLVKLTIPSIFGMLGLMIFNIVDTYFVAKLGTEELAAISFTFPLVILFASLTLGLGTGIMVLFSRAAGSHNVQEQRRLATSGLILAVLVASLITIIGFFTIEPAFRLMGAGDALMPHITAYMRIWYLGAVFIVIPMMGDHILRGLGDTKTPSYVMLTCAVVNAILDPILIFGLGPIPSMGITGAAIATVFARMITMIVSLLIQIYREHLISFKCITLRTMLLEWKRILFLGLPNSVVRMIVPVAIGIFTAILSRYGHETVAGYGVATKIEGFVMSVIFAFSITASVFVGQNLGAKQTERVKSGIRWLYIYSILYGMIVFVLLAICGRYFGAIFSDSVQVQQVIGRYLLIVPIGYGCWAISQMGASILNVLHKPLHSGLISLIQMFVFNVPLALLFSHYWQADGLFISIVLANIATSMLTLWIVRRQVQAAVAEVETNRVQPAGAG